MIEPVLRVEGAFRAFDRRTAVDRVNLVVKRGEFRAIIGPNGAGKSTLFNLISGVVRPQEGRIWFNETNITGFSPHRLCRLGMGRTFQINNIFLRSTVRENIRLAVLSHYRRSWNMTSRADDILTRETESIAASVGLADHLDKVGSELAYGDRRRLELGIALAGKPHLLLLDEPTCGVALVERPPLIGLIQDIVKSRGVTALLIEHDMDIVFAVADRITVMHKGCVIADDEPEAVQGHPEVQQVYLGE